MRYAIFLRMNMPTNLYEIIGDLSSKKYDDTVSFIMKFSKKKVVRKDEIIVTEGSPSDKVFIVLSGAFDVFRKDILTDLVIIAQLKEGDIFGEMGLFLDKKRTASVKSTANGVLAEFSNDDFLNALLQIPDLMYRLFRSFSQNLTLMNERMSRLNEKIVLKKIASLLLMNNLKNLSIPDDISISISEFAKLHSLNYEQVFSVLQYMKKNALIYDYKVISGSLVHFKLNLKLIFNMLNDIQ